MGKTPLSIVSGETGISPRRPLSHEGKALWDRVQGEYMVHDTGGCELLCLAGEALDRAQSLAAAIEKDGPVVYTRSGIPRTHPAVKEELACRAFVAYHARYQTPSTAPAFAAPSVHPSGVGAFRRSRRHARPSAEAWPLVTGRTLSVVMPNRSSDFRAGGGSKRSRGNWLGCSILSSTGFAATTSTIAAKNLAGRLNSSRTAIGTEFVPCVRQLLTAVKHG
jgi:hypothetical protein